MKFLVLAPNDLNVYDGTTIRVTGLIKSVATCNNEISLASASINKELKSLERLNWQKIRLYGYYTQILHSYSYSIFDDILVNVYAKIFLKSIKNIENPDLIHAHFLSTLPLALAFKRTSFHLPIIVDLHGLYCLEPIKFGYEPVNYLIANLFKIYELLKIDDDKIYSLTVPSQPLKQIITERFAIDEEKIHVVPDGIELNSVPKYDNSEVVRIRQEINCNNKIIVTYVGTTSFFHGFYDLIRAYKLAKTREPRLSLLLIVPFKDYTIKSLHRIGGKIDDVYVFGSMARSEIYKYLYASDVLILPHRKGTQFDCLPSNKLLDYMASGRPIVSYDLPSVSPLLKKYPYKILAEPNKPEKLATGILEAVNLFKNEHILGKSFVEEYDWSNIGKTLSKVYTDVLEH